MYAKNAQKCPKIAKQQKIITFRYEIQMFYTVGPFLKRGE